MRVPLLSADADRRVAEGRPAGMERQSGGGAARPAFEPVSQLAVHAPYSRTKKISIAFVSFAGTRASPKRQGTLELKGGAGIQFVGAP